MRTPTISTRRIPQQVSSLLGERNPSLLDPHLLLCCLAEEEQAPEAFAQPPQSSLWVSHRLFQQVSHHQQTFLPKQTTDCDLTPGQVSSIPSLADSAGLWCRSKQRVRAADYLKSGSILLQPSQKKLDFPPVSGSADQRWAADQISELRNLFAFLIKFEIDLPAYIVSQLLKVERELSEHKAFEKRDGLHRWLEKVNQQLLVALVAIVYSEFLSTFLRKMFSKLCFLFCDAEDLIFRYGRSSRLFIRICRNEGNVQLVAYCQELRKV